MSSVSRTPAGENARGHERVIIDANTRREEMTQQPHSEIRVFVLRADHSWELVRGEELLQLCDSARRRRIRQIVCGEIAR
jgi:hypothetical protein